MSKIKTHHAKIQTRILAITLSCILGMCVLVSFLSYFLFTTYMEQSLAQSTEASLYLLSDSINSNMADIYRLTQFCQTNSSITKYVNQSSAPDAMMAVSTHNRLYEEYSSNASNQYIPRLAVVNEQGFLQIVDTTYSTTNDLSVDVPNLTYFSQLVTANDYDFSVGLVNDPFLRRPHQVLPIIRPINYPYRSESDGFVLIEISANLFINSLRKYSTPADSFVFITIGGNQYIYEDNTLVLTQENLADSNTCVSVPLNMNDCYISQTISQEEAREQRKLFLLVILGIIVGLLGIGFLLINIMSRMIHLPVRLLQNRMERISEGNFDRDNSVEWDHELGDIGRGINDLAENVDTLMKDRLEDEKQKRDLEYKMLQSQINPHFIYNTLNSIKWMATIQGATGISEITTSLSRLLKSISKGTSTVIPLSEELALLQDYFLIQKYRYGGAITMNITMDDEALNQMEINKFTLQPIVENAVFHGIEPKGGAGTIDIHVYHDSDIPNDIIIDVTDDGVGITPEKLNALLSEKSDDKSDFFKEIGVYNVNKRLQYEFGDTYGITATSEVGKYTKMSIRLPFRKSTII